MKAALTNIKPTKLSDKSLSFVTPRKPFVARPVKKRNAMESTVVPNNSKETVEVMKVVEKNSEKVAVDEANATGDGPVSPIRLNCLNCERMAKNFMFLEDMIKTRGMSAASKRPCHTCLSALNYLQWLNQIIRTVFQENNIKTDEEAEKRETKQIIFETQSQKPVKRVKKKTPLRQTKSVKAKITENMKNGLRSHDGLDKPKSKPRKQSIIVDRKIKSSGAKY